MKAHIVLICLIFLCGSATPLHWKEDPNIFVDNYLSLFRELIVEIQDENQNLAITKNIAANFFTETTHLINFIAAVRHTSRMNDSVEAKALKIATEGIKSTWNEFWKIRWPIFKSDAMEAEWREILLEIGIEVLFTSTPRAAMAENPKYFREQCLRNKENVARYLRQRVTQGCQLNNTQVYVKLDSLFARLKKEWRNLNVASDESPLPLAVKESQDEISIRIHSLPVDEAIRQLDAIERKFRPGHGTSFTDVKLSINENRSTVQPTKECLTDDVFNGSLYNRTRIMSFIAQIQGDLTQLITISSLCGYLQFQNESQRLEQHLKESEEDIMSTFRFLADYVPRKLYDSPLGIEEIVVRNAIRDFNLGSLFYPDTKSDIPLNKIPALANIIYSALEDIGSKKIQKQILIAPSNSTEFSKFFICPQYWCSTILNQRGVDVIITRFPNEKMQLLSSLYDRAKETRLKMLDFLKEKYYLPLPQLVEEFERETNATLIDELVRSVAIVRHKTMAPIKCNYYALSYLHHDRVTNRTATSHFDYNNLFDKWWFHDNTCYSFYFFI